MGLELQEAADAAAESDHADIIAGHVVTISSLRQELHGANGKMKVKRELPSFRKI